MSNEQERAAFEAWAKENGFNVDARFIAVEADQYLATQHAWEGWQAASAGRAELLEALQSFVFEFGDKTNSATVNKARAAIRKANEFKG